MAISFSYPINNNIKIGDLLIGTTDISTNGKPIYQTKNFKVIDLINFIDGSAIWGKIYGDIEDQLDLQSALNLRALKSTTISTSAPLLGGGDLSANRVLSISQSGIATNGYLSSIDWNTFNNKQPALSGTGFVKISGSTISYDNSTYVPTSRTITINGESQNLSSNVNFTVIGGVTSVFTRTGDVIAQSGDYTTTQVTEGTNLYYTNARVSANVDVAANTAARHSAVTLGASQNGLSLSGQTLSLGLSSSTTAGALSSANWSTFNSKLSGSGTNNKVAKFTGTGSLGSSTITDDGTNVSLTGTITATGGFFNSDIRLKDIVSRDGDVIVFKWKDGRDDKTHVGYSAQEVQSIMPDAINEGSDGILSVNYIEVLVAKIAKMEKEIELLKAKG